MPLALYSVFIEPTWPTVISTQSEESCRFTHPGPPLGEDGLEVAFEEGAGVLEVLFGVGFGGGEALKRFVEQADDPLLFGQRGRGTSVFLILICDMFGCAFPAACATKSSFFARK